ncbi:MAG: helix-turn-helix transcriptional regulator [Oscillospiraceae bacterium]|nr:helix-turn-helix transcriptional regulator [Oscillospiraceae bacterium]
MIDRESIGQKLRTARDKRTLESVAAETGISASALGMYERGERVPKDEIKVTLANYYGKSVEELFFTQ